MKNKLSREDVVDLIVFLDFLKMDLNHGEDMKEKIENVINKLINMRDS